MPRRRRNEDGSLVVPLSPKQQENLARGRARLAELHGGAVAKESGGSSSKATDTAGKGQGSRRRVETVHVAKSTKKPAKASAPAKRSTASSRTNASPPVAKETPRKGLLERIFTET